MAQRRRVEVPVSEEMNRNLFTLFQETATQVTELYSLAQKQQKVSFEAGKKHALVELLEWLDEKQQGGAVATVTDVYAYLQSEIYDGMPSSGSGNQEQGCINSGMSSACGNLLSGLASSSSTSVAADNTQEMEVETNPVDNNDAK